jgi:microsomal dipeptidase-like Zn-dependent dipeptidase
VVFRGEGGAPGVLLDRCSHRNYPLSLERQTEGVGAVVVRSVEGLAKAHAQGAPAVVLGVEGADAIGRDSDRIDAWYERGVRVIGPVHLGDNALGTTCLPWQRYAGPLPVRRHSSPGLSPLGARVVERMMQLGVLADVAQHIAHTIGPEHLAVGTDMNGVPGLMAGSTASPTCPG